MPANRPAAQSAPLRVAQITDTHLYADPDGLLLGLNTRRCLQAVIKLALQAEAVDLVVASGDLAHDGTAEAYQQVRNCFSRMAAPVCCLPGNHDEAGALRDHLNHGGFYSHRSHCLGAWQLLFLDSTVAGSEGGGGDETEALKKAIRRGLADGRQGHAALARALAAAFGLSRREVYEMILAQQKARRTSTESGR